MVVCVACISYLLMTSMEKENFFVTRNLAKWLFARLEPYERHKRMTYIVGVILSVFITGAAVAFFINRFGRG
jgi:hypothetical protein